MEPRVGSWKAFLAGPRRENRMQRGTILNFAFRVKVNPSLWVCVRILGLVAIARLNSKASCKRRHIPMSVCDLA